MPTNSARLRFARGVERLAPPLGRLFTVPKVRGVQKSSTPLGSLFEPANPRTSEARAGGVPSVAGGPLVMVFASAPAVSAWLAASLAVRLDAVVLVLPSRAVAIDDVLRELAAAPARTAPTDSSTSSRTVPPDADPSTVRFDPSRVVVVGDADAARAAIDTVRAGGAARLALVSPRGVDGVDPRGIPTTLLQAAADGEDRSAVVELDRAMRAAGVAVRETEYSDIPDGWSRYPRLAPGSKRALDDLVAFLERGIGTPSTFEVIPGWDLH